MFHIDHIPANAWEVFAKLNIKEEDIHLSAKIDRDSEMQKREGYLFLCGDALVTVFCNDGTYQTYPRTEIMSLQVEELLSGGRLLAKTFAGEILLVASFTNFCTNSVQTFVKYANRALCDGKAPEAEACDDPLEGICPKCGNKYPNAERRVCPHCMEPGKLYRRFSVFLLRYKWSLLFILLSLVLLTAMSIIAPYLSSGFFYDQVIYGVGEFAGELLLVLGLVVGTRVLRLFANIINNAITSRVAAKMVYDLKKTIFSAIERLSLRFFTGRQTGGLMTQVNEDANTIYEFFCDGVPYMVINLVQVIVLTVLLFIMQPVLAATVLFIVPFFFVFMRWIFRKKQLLHAKRYSASSSLNSNLSDVLSGMRVVKAFSKEDQEIEKFDQKNKKLALAGKNLALFGHKVNPVAAALLNLGVIIAWGIGGYMVITGKGNMTYGILLTFISYVQMVFSPLEFFVNFFDWSANCSNAIQRLFEIMDARPEISEKENAIDPDEIFGKVEFDHVSFSYQKGKKIISDVSFTVESGEFLGIVGHTGAGKSTLANLLMRLYDVDEGEIRIDGIPIKDLSLSSIYRNVAIVSQETYLFIGSILDNIRYAAPNATYDEVVAAAKCAGAHEFIIKLPDAYHTRIGFGYKELSGGERQRISIARAILKNPKILILDEATAAMDTGTERKIQEALAKLIEGKTTIMIAHRLSTLRDADHLIVIEHGAVAERGTHEGLLSQKNGIYQKLYNLQMDALRRAGVQE